MSVFLKESVRGVTCNLCLEQRVKKVKGYEETIIPKGKTYLHFSGWNESINICEACLGKMLKEIKIFNREEARNG